VQPLPAAGAHERPAAQRLLAGAREPQAAQVAPRSWPLRGDESPQAEDEARTAQEPLAQEREALAVGEPTRAGLQPAVVLRHSPSAPDWPLALAAPASGLGQAARPLWLLLAGPPRAPVCRQEQ
jgi:hypothetical protein